MPIIKKRSKVKEVFNPDEVFSGNPVLKITEKRYNSFTYLIGPPSWLPYGGSKSRGHEAIMIGGWIFVISSREEQSDEGEGLKYLQCHLR